VPAVGVTALAVQHEPEQRRPAQVRGHPERQQQHEPHADEVGPGEHLAARPPVEEDADEGAERAERQEHDRQRPGDGGRRRRLLRGEDHVGRQGHLEHAVRELAGDPDGEQLSEPATP
jgi:hypothetical protein